MQLKKIRTKSGKKNEIKCWGTKLKEKNKPRKWLKKETIKRMNIISDIYQMESDEAEKNLKKKIRNKKKPIKRKIIIEFFLHYFFYQNNTTFTF
jgi:hypothetical protein